MLARHPHRTATISDPPTFSNGLIVPPIELLPLSSSSLSPATITTILAVPALASNVEAKHVANMTQSPPRTFASIVAKHGQVSQSRRLCDDPVIIPKQPPQRSAELKENSCCKSPRGHIAARTGVLVPQASTQRPSRWSSPLPKSVMQAKATVRRAAQWSIPHCKTQRPSSYAKALASPQVSNDKEDGAVELAKLSTARSPAVTTPRLYKQGMRCRQNVFICKSRAATFRKNAMRSPPGFSPQGMSMTVARWEEYSSTYRALLSRCLAWRLNSVAVHSMLKSHSRSSFVFLRFATFHFTALHCQHSRNSSIIIGSGHHDDDDPQG
mmetsp:Transcript_8059/g.21801  ORF Transcript_8059/g.21801 Transcript_8059/m.21801 type:complete len:325 (+) Transcript_8059:135-1109(+)